MDTLKSMNKYTLTQAKLFGHTTDAEPHASMEIEAESVSDGYHTMDELYEHRIRLYLALVKIYDNYITPMACHVVCWKSKLHDDGSSFDGWFILGMSCTKTNFDTTVTK